MHPFYAVLLAVGTTLGCSPAQKPTETSPSTSQIPVQQAVAIVSSVDAPDDLVRALYRTHDAGKSPFFQTRDRALIDHYFVDEVADLIWEDASIAEKTGDASILDADPLYFAQDKDIQDFEVHTAEVDGDQAEVLVTFTNFGEKHEFTFLLDKEEGRWLISDIFYGDGSQLFQLLSGRAEQMP